MVGIIIVSHGALAQEFVNTAAMLVGKGENVEFVGINPGDTPDEFYEKVVKAAKYVDTGQGVVALVDIFGGTPNNTVYHASKTKNIRIVTGVNLPMIIYAFTERNNEMTQDELIEGLIRTGRSEISEFGK
jgi:mannose/fructose/sorbose-specific phosphotransferase system IIA component